MHKPKERVRQKYKDMTVDYKKCRENREMTGSTVSRNNLRHRSETVATALEVVAELTLVENN